MKAKSTKPSNLHELCREYLDARYLRSPDEKKRAQHDFLTGAHALFHLIEEHAIKPASDEIGGDVITTFEPFMQVKDIQRLLK